MPVVNVRTVMTANGTANPLSGSQYEYIPGPAYLEASVTADATGVLLTLISGSDVLAEEGPVQVGTLNTFGRYPDDFFYTDEVAAGDRIKIALRDTSGAARTVMTSLRITPLG